MSEATIDKLVIDISSDAAKAVANINKLADSLDRLTSRTSATVTRLNRVCDSINKLKVASAGVNLAPLQKLNGIRISASLSNNLTTLTQALRTIPSDSAVKLDSISRSLTQLSMHNVSGVARSLNQLAGALTKLKSIGSAATQISQVSAALNRFNGAGRIAGANSVTQLAAAIKRLDKVGTSATRLVEIANAVNRLKQATIGLNLSPLKELSQIKISATIGNNLTKIATAVRAFGPTDATKLREVAAALSSLKELKGLNLGSAVNQLGKLPAVLREFQNTNMSALIQQVRQLNASLGPLARNVNLLASSLSKLPRSLRTQAAAARTVASTNKAISTSFYSGSTNAVRFATQCSALTGGLFLVSRALGNCINEANTYIENMNLFNASMGQYAGQAREYALRVQEAMGIDAGEWMRNQGVFQTLATGMGVASEKAAVMSQQLTQLGYDIASFFNMDVQTAMEKLQSGIAGELEPLRRIGWDLSNARMQLELTRLGIDANVSTMTQASKVGLRYYLIMRQVTQVHGDMARTIASPANQLRVLQAQLRMAARAIGNLLIPALNAILPFAIAAAKAIRILAIEIANFFGIDATFEVDYSGLDSSGISAGDFELPDDAIEDTAGSLGDVGSAADDAKEKVEELKRSVMGFDELNKLTATSDEGLGDLGDIGGGGGGGGAGGVTGGNTDFEMPTYDFLGGLLDGIGALTDKLAKKLADAFKSLLPIVAGIGAALGAWKLANALLPALQKLRSWLAGIHKDIDKINRKKIAPQLALPGPTSIFSRLVTPLAQAAAIASTLASTIASRIPTGIWQISAAAGIVTTHLTNLMINSDNFQRSVKMALDYFKQFDSPLDAILSLFGKIGEFIQQIVERVKTWAGEVGNLIVQLFAAIGIDITPLLDAFSGFISWMQSTFGPLVQGVFDTIGRVINDVFEIQWTDALMVAGAGVLALTGPFGQVLAAIMLVTEAITLVARAIGWANEPIVQMKDALEGVSEETQAAFGTALDSYNELILQMDTLDFGEAVVSQADVEGISTKVGNIRDTILNNLDAQRNEDLKNIKLTGYTEEELAAMEANVNQYYDNLQMTAQNGYARITEIVTIAKDQNRALTDEESAEITQIRQSMYDQLAMSSGASAEELRIIGQQVKDNETAAAAEAASNVIKSAKEKFETQKQEAENYLTANMNALDRMKDNNEIEKEEYDRLKDKVFEAYENMKNGCTESYDKIVEKTKEAMGDQADTIDWETGEIKTNWQQFCDDVSSAWDKLCQDVQDFYNQNLKPTFDQISAASKQVGDEIGKFLSDPVGYIQSAWSGICGWFQSNIIDPLAGAFKRLANGFIGGLNNMISGINSLSFTVPDWVPGIGGKHLGFNIPHIPYFARGGFVDTGQLFMAREAGPELVGTIGNKNAIANNQQIVEGIEQGVLSAMMQIVMLQSSEKPSEQTIEIPLRIGNEELARAVYKGNETLIRRGELVPVFM